MIKVVDIFAGPGGLSEGFAATTDAGGKPVFDVALSVEKDAVAYETLRLRTFFRSFSKSVPDDYYRLLRGEIDREALYAAYPAEAKLANAKSWLATLGPDGEPTAAVRRRIKSALKNETDWALIGGPPCQAYSIAGRSRNQGNPDYDPTEDGRQRLYVEYLQILAEHRPAVFVMENVKGLLSAKLNGEGVFRRIVEDLRDPAVAIARERRNSTSVQKGGYSIYSLTDASVFKSGTLDGAVIHAEEYGIPQARHRVILLGVRDDLRGVKPGTLAKQKAVSASTVIDDLPSLRSGLSGTAADSAEAWIECLQSQTASRWVNAGTRKVSDAALVKLIRSRLNAIVAPRADRGGEFLRRAVGSSFQPEWFSDPRIEGVCNHSSRGHMRKDLFRYFYAACYAKQYKHSPSLKDFPTDLLPRHLNVGNALESGGHFSDRFRVQLRARPSTTIVSHISKDGHYYIHPDPLQCRSLTVREAARLQTFPDNYFFCGNRTAQYVQVGNAVPPLLARQIGGIVRDIIRQAGANG